LCDDGQFLIFDHRVQMSFAGCLCSLTPVNFSLSDTCANFSDRAFEPRLWNDLPPTSDRKTSHTAYSDSRWRRFWAVGPRRSVNYV